MKYATWTVDRTDGSTPEPTISLAGGSADGAMWLDGETILGYISNDVAEVGLEKWGLTIVTLSDALTLAQTISPEFYLNDEETFSKPLPIGT